MSERRRPWWEELGDALPDPWADFDDGAAELTEDQHELLAELADQPPPPRVRGLGEIPAGERTGNVPGDTADGDS